MRTCGPEHRAPPGVHKSVALDECDDAREISKYCRDWPFARQFRGFCANLRRGRRRFHGQQYRLGGNFRCHRCNRHNGDYRHERCGSGRDDAFNSSQHHAGNAECVRHDQSQRHDDDLSAAGWNHWHNDRSQPHKLPIGCHADYAQYFSAGSRAVARNLSIIASRDRVSFPWNLAIR